METEAEDASEVTLGNKVLSALVGQTGNWDQPCSNHCNETSDGNDCCTKKIHLTLRQRLEFTHMDTRLLLTCEYRSVIHQRFNVNLEAGR